MAKNPRLNRVADQQEHNERFLRHHSIILCTLFIDFSTAVVSTQWARELTYALQLQKFLKADVELKTV